MHWLQLVLAPAGVWWKSVWVVAAARSLHGGAGCLVPTPASPLSGNGFRPRRLLDRPRDWSDRELVARLAQGDPDASGEMVRRFGFLIRFLCSGRSAGHLDSEDLEQETWVHLAADNWHTVCAWETRCPLSAYLSVVVTRAVRAMVQRGKREAEATVSLDSMRVTDVPPASPAGQGPFPREQSEMPPEDLAAVRLCVRKLPESQRLAISLRFFDALSHRDIAGLLGISIGTSRKRVFDGLRGLERMLSESYPHLLNAPGALR